MEFLSLLNLIDPELNDIEVVVKVNVFLLIAEDFQVVAVPTEVPLCFCQQLNA